MNISNNQSIFICLFFCIYVLQSTTMAFNLINSMMWRSALKTFKKVNPSSVNIEPILESIRLSPSSFGIQPYQVHVISNQDLKTKLRAVSYDQPQVKISRIFSLLLIVVDSFPL